MDPEELVTIDRFIYLGAASIARATLEASGIEAVLVDENIVRMSWGEATAHGGVRLQVRRSDAPLAIAMLTAEEIRSFDTDENSGDQTPPSADSDRCLRCGSEEVYPTETRARTYARGLVFSILGVMLINLGSCAALLMHLRAPQHLFSAAYMVALAAPVLAVAAALIAPAKLCRNCNARWRGVQRIS
jgi:hypothetical protein